MREFERWAKFTDGRYISHTWGQEYLLDLIDSYDDTEPVLTEKLILVHEKFLSDLKMVVERPLPKTLENVPRALLESEKMMSEIIEEYPNKSGLIKVFKKIKDDLDHICYRKYNS